MNISARLRADNEHRRTLEELVEFERLVGDIAARFVNVNPADVDDAIIDAQRRIVEALNLDRSSLFQLSDDATDDFVLTHSWSAVRRRRHRRASRRTTTSHGRWLESVRAK